MLLSDFIKSIISDFRSSNDRSDEKRVQELLDTCEEDEEGVLIPETVKIRIGNKDVEIAKFLFKDPSVLAPQNVKFSVDTDIHIEEVDGEEVLMTGLKQGLDKKSSHISIEMELDNRESPELYSKIIDKLLSDTFKG